MKAQLLMPPYSKPLLWLICIGRVKLGINLKSGWCLQLRAQTIPLKTKEDMIPLLPLLETGRAQVIAHFSHVVKDCPECATWKFPDVLLLNCAFELSVSDYWPEKALDWLDSDASLMEVLHDSLLSLMHQRWIGQKLKQRVTLKLRLQSKQSGTGSQ